MTIIVIINIVLLNPEFSINRTTDLVIRKMHRFVGLLGEIPKPISAARVYGILQ